MNKFTQFRGNKDCPKCKGKGHYYYDENHAQICELCCTHPEGFIELDKEYYPEMVGQEVCKFGCGSKRVKPTMNIKDLKKEFMNKYEGANTVQSSISSFMADNMWNWIEEKLSQSNQEILDKVNKEVIGIVISESYPFDIVLSKPTLKTLLDLQIKKLEQLKLSIKYK
jgi:hypothetical protein